MEIADRLPDRFDHVDRLTRVVERSFQTAAEHRRDQPSARCPDQVDLSPCRTLVAALLREISLLRRGLADAPPPAPAAEPRRDFLQPEPLTPWPSAGPRLYGPAPLGKIAAGDEPPPPPALPVHLDSRLVVTNLGTLLDILA